MADNVYVLDANVFLEYIFNRSLEAHARQIIRDAIAGNITVFLPTLVLDEISEVLCGNMDEPKAIEEHLGFIEELIRMRVLTLVVPDISLRMRSIDMARQGHVKSGYPQWTDCLYHALAIIIDGVFLTNDRKHMAKTRMYGHVLALQDY